jgi:hypothetical protein
MRPLLPQLRNTLAPGPVQGDWNVSPRSIFGTIAQALKYDQAVRTNINSIPSPWARALLFQSVFLTDQYPNRQELIHEYIGFLAVLAFAKVKNLPIQAKLIKLKDLAKANAFADSLFGLLPSDKDSVMSASSATNPWETIFTFSLNGHPLGFTSPATLAVPSIWINPQLTSYIPWLEEAPLIGPGKRNKILFRYSDPKNHLGQQEKAAFGAWLNNIKQSIPIDTPNQDLRNRLAKIIDEYLNDLGVEATTAPAVSTSLQIFGVALNPKPLDALAQVIDPDSIRRSSNVRVSQGIRVHPEPLYFVDKDLVPQVLHCPSHEVCVEGAITLAAFDASSSADNRSGCFWTADDFFLPRLRWFRSAGILSGSWLDEIQPDPENRTIVPPINPEVAKFFGSEDFKNRMRMMPTMTAEGQGVRVSFELEISGLDKPAQLGIYRDYPIRSEDELKGELPYMALWPNLPNESRWSTYYLSVQESKVRSSSSYAFTAEMISDEAHDSILTGDLGTVYRVWQSKEHPDVLRLIDKRGDRIGILPISIPALSPSRSAKWVVGVDFGTSFTNLHVSKAGARERLDLSMLTLNIINLPENFATNKDYFIPQVLTAPPGGSNPPMATLLTIRGAGEGQDTPEFLTKSRVDVPSLDERSLGEDVISDIKWSKPKYLDAFLTALVNLVSAHASKYDVSEITWKASYPTAFSDSEVSRYKNSWDRALRAATRVSKVRHKLGIDGSASTAFQTESIAFAQYFADVLGEQLAYTTCLDIGGGTSDISIWKDMSLIHQLSIPFAGRDIFHHTLSRNIARVGEIFGLSDSKAYELLLDLKESGDNFDAYLDSYLRLKGDSVLERLRNAGQTDVTLKFRGLLALAYAGLYYYIGLVLRYLNQAEATPVYLGGNGSRFINWIDPDGQYSESSDINKLLSYVLAKAGGFATDVRRDTTVSKDPKQEAAGGLVVDQTRLKGLSSSTPEAYAGIDMTFETDIGTLSFKPEDALILPEQCQEIRSISISDFSEIGSFIEVFNEAIRVTGIKDITSPIAVKNGKAELESLTFDLTNEVKALLNSRKSKGPGSGQSYKEVANVISRQNYEPDPGFVVAHKALLSVLAKQWAKMS